MTSPVSSRKPTPSKISNPPKKINTYLVYFQKVAIKIRECLQVYSNIIVICYTNALNK
jgi:hypothetical protein